MLRRKEADGTGQKPKTVLFSTHIMEQAEKICSSIFLMNKGGEVISGPLDEIKDRFGRRTAAVEFSGDGSFISKLPQVENDSGTFSHFCRVGAVEPALQSGCYVSGG